MAMKRKKDKTYPPNKEKKREPKKEEVKEEKKQIAILEAVEVMSSSYDGLVDRNKKAWNAKAEALEKLINGDAYGGIVSREKNENEEHSYNDSIEEIVVGDAESDSCENYSRSAKTRTSTKKKGVKVESKTSAPLSEEENSEDKSEQDRSKKENGLGSERQENGEDDEQDVKDSEQKESQRLFDFNSRALLAKTEELAGERKDLGWVEKFDVSPTTPLPFGTRDEQTGLKLHVHDDLKREVAFYDIAMEAVKIAKEKCKEGNVLFSRPSDFFAEMVKSDDQMARIKDRLIFESRKMEAVAQRKSNREQKLRSRESHANKIAEKSRRKKDNMNAIEEWAQASSAANRGGNDNVQDDQKFLKNLSFGTRRPWTDRDGNLQTGPNKKRMAANKKYGYGGKRGRFKQNGSKSINDMSGFNPRGNFGGLGTKNSVRPCGNRKGKRARDVSRSKQQS